MITELITIFTFAESSVLLTIIFFLYGEIKQIRMAFEQMLSLVSEEENEKDTNTFM